MLRLPRSARTTLACAAVLVFAGLAPAADTFRDTVRPFLATYCIQCHNKDKASGELDLTRFTSAAQVGDDFRQWENVVTFLKSEEMPPPKAKQPAAAERAAALAALDAVILGEARKSAGDPGLVPPRRLSNAEYNYTVHDLTGVDIRPADSFPVDPAAGEGFNNTGEALTMSPGLFKKYLAAAEHVADHALLTPSGLRFAPHPVVTFADRQKYAEQAIIRFYETHAVDHEKYLAALWLYRYRPADRQAATPEEWAVASGLSPKYLRSLWDAVGPGSSDRFLLAWLRRRFDAVPAPKDPARPAVTGEVQAALKALAAEAQRIGKDLAPPETPAIVANAGNGPIDHLERRRRTAASRDTFDPKLATDSRFQVEFKNVAEKPSFKLVVQAADAGDARADGFVIVNGSFTTNAKTTDGKKKWSLREVVTAHAPDEAKRLAFGTHPRGDKIDADAFVIKAPGLVEIEVPAKAFALRDKGNVTFTAECRLAGSKVGVATVRVLDRVPTGEKDVPDLSRLVFQADVPAADEFRRSAVAFCRLFPNRFFHVDSTRGLSAGFHLIEGFFRDDQPLCRSVLSDAEARELDRLWDELYFVTGIWEKLIRGFTFFERSERNFLKHPDFDGFREEDPELVKDETLARFQEVYLRRSGVKATGEELARHPITIFFTDIRNGLRRRAEVLKGAEDAYLKDLLAFAARAYRRPLTEAESRKLEQFYRDICDDKDHGVEGAVRASVVRVLASPHFCYRIEATPAGQTVAPLSDLALASRLSYFLWASAPDAELLEVARAGRLHDDRVLCEQVRRMVKDEKVSRFAREFFGQWLGYRDFLSAEAVNRQAFPAFDDALKLAMFEEPTRLATHLIREGKPITALLDGDETFLNKKLAQHYGMPFRGTEGDWELTGGLRERGRGGVLGMAVFLTKNSQPQRTSPVKRGFWVVHKLLGEHIPPPPPDVAVLPAKETDTDGKTIRQLLALHTTDAKCAACHRRFDPVGLAMEGFDPIGRVRLKDLAGRPVDNAVLLPTGKEVKGVPEFGQYLAAGRKDDFTRTLCQKFLGYALGRSLQVSDRPLLEKMRAALEADGSRLAILFEVVATSPQFRNQRCRDFDPVRFRESVRGE